METALNFIHASRPYAPVPPTIETFEHSYRDEAAELRAKLDAIYARAFARPPKPVDFARLMAAAKCVHDELVACDSGATTFTTDVARSSGLHLKKVQRLVARGLKVMPEVLDAVGRSKHLNTGTVLDQLASLPEERQMAHLEAMRDEPARNPVSDEDRAKVCLAQFGKLPKRAQRLVLASLAKSFEKGEL